MHLGSSGVAADRSAELTRRSSGTAHVAAGRRRCPLSARHAPPGAAAPRVRCAAEVDRAEGDLGDLGLGFDFDGGAHGGGGAAAVGSCYGCGAALQTGAPDGAGFVPAELFADRARHRHLHLVLCARCRALAQGEMVPGVADFAAAPPGAPPRRLLATPEQLRAELAGVRDRPALVVLLVDLLDASGSLLGRRVRDLVGRNPVVLVGTKADLLPAGTDLESVAEWLAAAAAFKKLSLAGVHLVSSRTCAGVPAAAAALRRERRGRDVVVLGAANVGKSAFVRALVREMADAGGAQHDPAARAHRGRLPVESAMPGTTLRPIPLRVFSAGGALLDTPGLHLHHRAPHLLTPEECGALHPRRRLRGFVAPAPHAVAGEGGESLAASGAPDAAAPLASYWWGGVARIDVLSCPPDTRLVFYGPPALRVEAEAGGAGAPGGGGAAAARFAAGSVAARGGLRLARRASVPAGPAFAEAAADVAVSGLPGWVAVHARGRRGAAVELAIWAPPGVEAHVRPSLPTPPPFAEEQAA
jgi:nitric-oxide synthase